VDSPEQVDRPRALLVIATVVLITASWVAFLAPIAVQNFGGTFTALGADLPASTRWLLAMTDLWRIFLVLAVALFLWIMARTRVTPRELGRMKLALRLLIVVMLLAFGVAAWAIYTPLFKLGDVV
jgi:type II secretory pathway component PulF